MAAVLVAFVSTFAPAQISIPLLKHDGLGPVVIAPDVFMRQRTHQWMLLRCPSVQKAMGLSDDEKSNVWLATEPLLKAATGVRVSPDSPDSPAKRHLEKLQGKPGARDGDWYRESAEAISNERWEQLDKIWMQLAGPLGVLETPLIAKLNLSKEQRAAIEDVVAPANVETGTRYEPGENAFARAAKQKHDYEQKVVAALDGAQRREFESWWTPKVSVPHLRRDLNGADRDSRELMVWEKIYNPLSHPLLLGHLARTPFASEQRRLPDLVRRKLDEWAERTDKEYRAKAKRLLKDPNDPELKDTLFEMLTPRVGDTRLNREAVAILGAELTAAYETMYYSYMGRQAIGSTPMALRLKMTAAQMNKVGIVARPLSDKLWDELMKIPNGDPTAKSEAELQAMREQIYAEEEKEILTPSQGKLLRQLTSFPYTPESKKRISDELREIAGKYTLTED